MKKILVTGAEGQLGKCIRDRDNLLSDFEVHYIDINELDLSNSDAVSIYFADLRPDIVINCAAYTNVDGAESESATAFLINAEAVGTLAELCEQIGSTIYHIGTDYIFDAKHSTPLKEEDKVSPRSVYGKSKLEGEKRIIQSGCKSVIIRTSWLYSEYNHNFLKTVIHHCTNSGQMGIVFDQVGTPTYAGDLADVIMKMVKTENVDKQQEVYHYSNEGVCSWYDFAMEIKNIQKIKCKINPILTHEFPLPAPRPTYSVLNKSKIKKHLNLEIPHWMKSLRKCILKYNELERSA